MVLCPEQYWLDVIITVAPLETLILAPIIAAVERDDSTQLGWAQEMILGCNRSQISTSTEELTPHNPKPFTAINNASFIWNLKARTSQLDFT